MWELALLVVAALALIVVAHFGSAAEPFAARAPAVGKHTYDRPDRRAPAAAAGVDPAALAELAALTALGVY